MTVAEIKSHVQLYIEDKDANIYSNDDIARAIDGAIQKIPALLDKQYLSRLLYEQKISSGLSTAEANDPEDVYLTNGRFTLDDLTTNNITDVVGYELAFDQIDSAFLLPNSFSGRGASISDDIVWIHVTDQLGRYELNNSYMYTPAGDSPVFVRTGTVLASGSPEVAYDILPKQLHQFGTIYVVYYRKPNRVFSISGQEPECATVSHEAISYFACAELLASDGEMERSKTMESRAFDIVNALNEKVGNMDLTKKSTR